jgi:signal transduction histidine kinase
VVADDALAPLQLDPARIREVLENLLSNSLRYTPAGGRIEVTCRRRESPPAVVLSVTDTGSGISPEELPHVFDRLYRGSDSAGMGLGLAIAKDLVEAHGGQITAESEPGRGTAVECAFPPPSGG